MIPPSWARVPIQAERRNAPVQRWAAGRGQSPHSRDWMPPAEAFPLDQISHSSQARQGSGPPGSAAAECLSDCKPLSCQNRMRGVILRTWEHPSSINEFRSGRAELVSGREFGPVEVSPADATIVGLTASTYGPGDGTAYLKAVWATYCRGSRLRAERFRLSPPACAGRPGGGTTAQLGAGRGSPRPGARRASARIAASARSSCPRTPLR